MQCETLLNKVLRYNPSADTDVIEQAFKFASKAHEYQVRENGNSYIHHPLAVAEILSEKKLDTSSIITALLHDTVEDTAVTLKEIEANFGTEVSDLVNGVTKLNKLNYTSASSAELKAESFRKFIIASSKDIRVLIVKLADRLHNLKTLHYINSSERVKRIANESLDIYVPLAERIGLTDWKQQMEDIAFKYLNSDAWDVINTRLTKVSLEDKASINLITSKVTKILSKAGVKAEVTGRKKTPYSIWKKMQKKNIAFESLADIFAFRVLVETIEECYKVLGLLHSNYQADVNYFKDYISVPKENGYSSIHTKLVVGRGRRIEVQIRTQEMNLRAEYGIAAHWSYKENGSAQLNSYDGKQYRWLNHLIEILENTEDIEEFIEHTKMEMYRESVFVFSPKGELITLASGSTPLDYAYAIHTEIGNHFVSAKINGILAPMQQELKNADVVEIISNKKQNPKEHWENFCVTGKARSAIRRYIKNENTVYSKKLGRKILETCFLDYGYKFDNQVLKLAAASLATKPQELLLAVAKGEVLSRNVVFNLHKLNNEADIKQTAKKTKKQLALRHTPNQPLPINGIIGGMAVSLATCCSPLPGERIVGISTTAKGISIHRTSCDNLKFFEDSPENWVNVTWDSDTQDEKYNCQIEVCIENKKGALSSLTNEIAKNNVNISNITVISRSHDYYVIDIDLEIEHLAVLENLLSIILLMPIVNSVKRVKK